MKLRRFYPLSIAALAVTCASLFWVSTILPSFVSVYEAGRFESSPTVQHVIINEARLKEDSLGIHFSNFENTRKQNLKSNGYHSESPNVSPMRRKFDEQNAQATSLRGEIKLSTNKPSRYVTKSLAEIGYVSGRVNPDFLFFNRVPKCGSEMLVLLLQWLQGQNGFKHVRLGGGNIRRLKRLQQEEIVDEVVQQEKEGVPLSFDRHVYWLNFSSFDHSTPVWINLIRDPVEKAASRFYYGKELKKKHHNPARQTFEECVMSGVDKNCAFKTGKMYDLTIPYFCGHEKWCMALNDQWALEEAKANVDRFYPVVGVLEEINATLTTLEKKLPRFFSGVQEMYFTELLEPHHNKNRKRPREINDVFRNHLKSSLKLEYEFYDFIRSRLLQQLRNYQ